MPTSNDIRKQFIDFFTQKDHTFVPSSSVLPPDPTLLFTNAGMNQFKDIFLGKENPPYKRAVNSQKCIRAGGKHNDLDAVGKDAYHHTFFEMLGNWSFGDYYKKEAIQWAWELLTKVWKLPKDKLYATVYNDDDEAYNLWKSETDIDHTHISRHGEKDNFWEMGETGPCGPCSEIHIDRGKEFCNLSHLPDHVCGVNGDCHRYIELWNLVFIQFQRHPDKSLTPLKNKYVDTGAGFERLCQVLQHKASNYDTDVFTPILADIVSLTGVPYTEADGMPHRVIADHIRTLTFAIADGCVPSNEGRGYVLRRILRRAVRYGRNLNQTAPFFYKLVDSVVKNMGEAFPEIVQRSELVKTVIKEEETRFSQTLDKGLVLFAELVSKVKDTGTINGVPTISGKDAFTLYDTYGFPLDLTMILASEQGLSVDEEGFAKEMAAQQQRAREASQFKLTTDTGEWAVFSPDTPTRFVGYDTLSIQTHIIRYSFTDSQKVMLVLSETPFYAESGGQIADRGLIQNESGSTKIAIYDVRKEGDVWVHYGEFISRDAIYGVRTTTDGIYGIRTTTDGIYGIRTTTDGINAVPTIASVDIEHRAKVARNHTATHLLHKALKTVLGDHVQQRGSLVGSDMLRFDFTHFSAMTPDQIQAVEKIVNSQIWSATPVNTTIQSLQDAKDSGAVALFGEKYGDNVRVVSVADFSRELCGGTHIQNTGSIGIFKILSETSISAGVRRIEAITAEAVRQYITENETMLDQIYTSLSAHKNNILQKIEKLHQEHKNMVAEITALRTQNLHSTVFDLLAEKHLINGVDLVYALVNTHSIEDLKTLADLLREKLTSGIAVLVAEIDCKVSILALVTPDLTSRYSAGKIVASLAQIVDGKGGGRADMAMAGGKAVEKIPELMEKIPSII